MTCSLSIAMLLVTLLRRSSIQEHGVETNNWGHPYIGTQISIISFPCLVELSSIFLHSCAFCHSQCALVVYRGYDFTAGGFSDQTGKKKANNG